MNELELRVKWAKAKLRNIIYYRLEVEPTVPERFRGQYMHILRQYRKDVLVLMSELPESMSDDYEWLKRTVNLIPPKVKTDDCLGVIESLIPLFKGYEGN